MKDVADDLLDDLEELESSSNKLERQLDKASKKQQTYNKLGSKDTLDAATMLLETAHIAQESAFSSQTAAESNLKLNTEYKLQLEDLSEVNASFRQTLRNQAHEAKSAKNFFIGMFILVLVMGLAFVGAQAWLLNNQEVKERQFKIEMLDLIQTESALNQRQINLKIDELASIIETRPTPSATVWPDRSAPDENHHHEHTQSENETAQVAHNHEEEQLTHKDQTPAQPRFDASEIHQQLQQTQTLLSELNQSLQSTPPAAANINEVNHKLTRLEQLASSQVRKLDQLIAAQGRSSGTVSASPSEAKQWAELGRSLANRDAALLQQIEELKHLLETLNSQQQTATEQIRQLESELERASEQQPYSYRNPHLYQDN